MTRSSATYLSELYWLVNQHFNLAELRTLCLDLNVDYESLAGEEKLSRIRELLLGLGRNGRLPDFITLLQQVRPNVAWLLVPDDFELPVSLSTGELTTAGDTNIEQIGDIFNVGDITGSYTAIGNGAQVIVNQIEQALSAIEEMEKGVQVAENRLARAIQSKIDNYIRLPTTVGAEAYRNPYRSLLNYRIEDSPYFYGRQEAIRKMLLRLDRNRLTVLQSDSGSGKTSLLQAGLAARLLAARHLPLYIRPHNEPPHMAIKRSFLPDYTTLDELERFRDDKMSLLGFLRRVTSYLGPRKLFIFLDQFEEFFNDLNSEKEAFSQELQQCIDDPQLDVGWVLSLREEYFAKLRLFEAVRPFENWYFLETFLVQEAREVITQPAQKMGVTYENNLVGRIIKDVSNDDDALMPVHVQLVCTTLFDERHELSDPAVISEGLYNRERGEGESKASGAKGILRSHLSRTMKQQMIGQERQLAFQVLRTLITSQKYRAQRSRKEILNELQAIGDVSTVDESSFDDVLKNLENNHLIRTDEDDKGELNYELAHDYLLDEIEVDPQFQAIKFAQEILTQEVPFFIDRGVLLAEDKFNIVNSHREFLNLDEITLELLNKSEEHFEAERTRELRQAQELAEQRENARRQAVRVSRRNLALLVIVSTIAVGFFVILYVFPWIMKNTAANDEFAELVPVEMEDGSIVEFEAYEVTNERYAKCVDWGPCNRPDNWSVIYPENRILDKDNAEIWNENRLKPVVGVTMEDAMFFCTWIDRILPTADQWIQTVPHPNKWQDMTDDEALFVFDLESEPVLTSVSVRSKPQYINGYQEIYDLVGSVEEWTRTTLVDIEGENDMQCRDVMSPQKISSDAVGAISLGDSFSDYFEFAGETLNDNVNDSQKSLNYTDNTLGFRCVSHNYVGNDIYSCRSIEPVIE